MKKKTESERLESDDDPPPEPGFAQREAHNVRKTADPAVQQSAQSAVEPKSTS